MLINNQLGASDSFFRKSEIEFIGSEINFSFMTDRQLDKAIYDSIILFNKTFPPPKKSRFNKVFKVAVISGIALGTGAAVLASYGMSVESAWATAKWAGGATAKAGGGLATVQKAATGIAAGGMLYGKVTGETPKDLVKVADMVSSKNALDVMEKVATDELDKRGATIQDNNTGAKLALREKLAREQKVLAENLRKQAAIKANNQGQPLPNKKSSLMNVVALVTPFILMKLGG